MVQKNSETRPVRSCTRLVVFEPRPDPPKEKLPESAFKSKVPGVSWSPPGNVWVVRLTIEGVSRYYGGFANKLDAESVATKLRKESPRRNRKDVVAGFQAKRKPHRDSSSKYKGVGWQPRRGKWVAKANKAHIRSWIGYFDSEQDAALAYDAKAKELWGDECYLNQDHFPEDFL